ncbi:MAG: 23S rRNA (adenine(2503)-C(2))-methyltransferase RlmN [Clostridia bacterium]|nr:23S rRNA (adenine(2503)-C(2))-methyltransferase RlmN [Clostridia bacterium]MBQ7289076.1 23S rRNA (adenine(2503)-C(2))-methyltransferase RlmN [Clostridia bacterium]
MGKTDIRSMYICEIADWLAVGGFPKFHAKQIFSWLHQKFVQSFEEMTDLPKKLRAELEKSFYIVTIKTKKKLASAIDDTIKYLYELPDGELVESVLMKYHHGYTVCVSTQIGCKMGCTFCASCKNGFVRNLFASEILAQVVAAEQDAGVRVSNVVMMGMGEPLDNFEASLRFIRLVTAPEGMNIGCRHISLSTSGVVPNIYKLADLQLPVTLSVSLHASDDTTRSRIMPVNQKWNIAELLKACRYFLEHNGRRISFEYALIHGENDTVRDADDLAALLKGMLCHVNLIPVNNVHENQYIAPNKKSILQFQKRLETRGITATVRRTLGSDVNASCGQLRNQNL